MLQSYIRKHKYVHNNFMDKNRLQEIIIEKNLSYGQLSKMTGISKSTLFRIANFYQSPTQDVMISIARGLKMKVVDVFNLDY